ncbi:MAG: ribonuclease HII [Bacillota bacterium]|nr:ribonuclease HII [Bacillota bacterium]
MTIHDPRLHERRLEAAGYRAVCGVDEAGRGPLAGPLLVAACILPEGHGIKGIDDSKRLGAKRREKLAAEIRERADACAVVEISVEEIERYNILGATRRGMVRAISALDPPADFALTDAVALTGLLDIPHEPLIHGDRLSESIAAASILAKVTRDARMREYDALYPEYGFARHMGYGTAAHREALDEHGPSAIHRPSFLDKWRRRRLALLAGSGAEDDTANLLEARGWRVLVRRWSQPGIGDLDLIAARGTTLLAVEVKARSGEGSFARAGEALTGDKVRRMEHLALAWLRDQENFVCRRIVFAAALVELATDGQVAGLRIVPIEMGEGQRAERTF